MKKNFYEVVVQSKYKNTRLISMFPVYADSKGAARKKVAKKAAKVFSGKIKVGQACRCLD